MGTWQKKNTGLSGNALKVYDVAACWQAMGRGRGSLRVWIATEDGLYLSEDGAESWSKVSTPGSWDLRSVAVPRDLENTVIVLGKNGADEVSVHRSDDLGGSWASKTLAGGTQQLSWNFDLDTEDWTFHEIDGESTGSWHSSGGHNALGCLKLESGYPGEYSYGPIHGEYRWSPPGTIILHNGDKLLSWNYKTDGYGSDYQYIGACFTDATEEGAGGNDGRDSWRFAGHNMHSFSTLGTGKTLDYLYVTVESTGNQYYAHMLSYWDDVILEYDMGSAGFTLPTTGYPSLLAVSPAGTAVYASVLVDSEGSIYKLNAGLTSADEVLDTGAAWLGVMCDFEDTDRIWAFGNASPYIQRSTDGATSWHSQFTAYDVRTMLQHPRNLDKLYAAINTGSGYRAYVSTDGGGTWGPGGNLDLTARCAGMTPRSRKLYQGASLGDPAAQRSDDQGATWADDSPTTTSDVEALEGAAV